jgi:hypothetical protein
MVLPDVSRWTKLGSTDNADMYEVEPGVLAVVPHEGCADTAETARQSVEFQHRHWAEAGRGGGAVVFVDRIRDQSAGARQVYGSLPDAARVTGFALVGGTVFGRAVASVFLGLNPPAAPTKLFGDLDAALAWLRERNRQGAGGLPCRPTRRASRPTPC